MKIIVRVILVSGYIILASLGICFAQEGILNYPGKVFFIDPSFQDYVETNFGHLKKKQKTETYRDAPGPVKISTFKTVLPGKFKKMSGQSQGFLFPETPETSKDAFLNLKKFQSPENGRNSRTAATGAASAASGRKAAEQTLFYKINFAGEPGAISSYVPFPGNVRTEGTENMDYVQVGILVSQKKQEQTMNEIFSRPDFKFVGERVVPNGKSDAGAVILGLIPATEAAGLLEHQGVSGIFIERSDMSLPFNAKIRFTVKVPCSTDFEKFISVFVRKISAETGFVFESRSFPDNAVPGCSSKFTAVELSGFLPVTRIKDLFKSPFVAAPSRLLSDIR
ncbi:MAG: hypothetical protein HY746_08005 [Elusimicrobia bacterium]|nr:hypothetical protein [Elusimicrobiota bacterium]